MGASAPRVRSPEAGDILLLKPAVGIQVNQSPLRAWLYYFCLPLRNPEGIKPKKCGIRQERTGILRRERMRAYGETFQRPISGWDGFRDWERIGRGYFRSPPPPAGAGLP
jgi:hypothetical protein